MRLFAHAPFPLGYSSIAEADEEVLSTDEVEREASVSASFSSEEGVASNKIAESAAITHPEVAYVLACILAINSKFTHTAFPSSIPEAKAELGLCTEREASNSHISSPECDVGSSEMDILQDAEITCHETAYAFFVRNNRLYSQHLPYK